LGTKFISETIPTNPSVDGAVALAELFREGIPSMIGSAFLKDRASFFRSVGSEYLNVEFGWKPLVKDLRDSFKAILESQKTIENLVKNSGRELRRERLHPPERVVGEEYHGDIPVSALPMNTIWTSTPRYYQRTTAVRQQWFSGEYTYYVDPAILDGIEGIAAKARYSLGLRITPDVLWNLAPWSWLVDWFLNVGPILSNLSAFSQDGLVLRRGYVMENVTKSIYCESRAVPWEWVNNHSEFVACSWNGTAKRRAKATPYGFGLNTDMFSNRQWAILGALGITRAPR
jgi:hypothetical protein